MIGSVPYWREIRLADGRTGWAAKKFLEPAGPVSPEPAPAPIPADVWLEVHFVDVGCSYSLLRYSTDHTSPGIGSAGQRELVALPGIRKL